MKRYTDKLAFRYKGDKLIFDVKEKNGYLVYRVGGKGNKYFFSNNDELIKIFKTYKLTPVVRRNNRLIFTYREKGKGGKQYSLFAHDLAYSVYNGYVKCDSFYDDMRNYFNHKGELTIDHADGNVINNTINNLSLMIINNNRKKGNITSKLKLPEKLIIAYDSNGYLFEITMIINRYENLKALLPPHIQMIDGAMCRIRFYADNADDLVKQLDYITKAKTSWRTPLRRKDGRWIKDENKNKAIIDDVERSIYEQRRLLNLYSVDETVFNRI